ncbi:Ribosomal-protein-serine acetyltransferase [compost metagenome]
MRYYAERGEVRRFVIKCRVANAQSNSVAVRNGFELEGCLKEAEFLNGEFQDVNSYAKIIRL